MRSFEELGRRVHRVDSVKHLQENIESTKLVLTAEDMKEIASALAEFKVHGGRMNEEQMKVIEQ